MKINLCCLIHPAKHCAYCNRPICEDCRRVRAAEKQRLADLAGCSVDDHEWYVSKDVVPCTDRIERIALDGHFY